MGQGSLDEEDEAKVIICLWQGHTYNGHTYNVQMRGDLRNH